MGHLESMRLFFNVRATAQEGANCDQLVKASSNHER